MYTVNRFKLIYLATALLASLYAQGTPAGTVGWYNGDCQTGGFANWYTGSRQFARAYDNFEVPQSGWTITGLFSNNLVSITGVNSAVWEIRTGTSVGQSGTLVAAGMSPATQNFITTWSSGYSLYRIQVDGLRIRLAPGTYWLSVSPVVPYKYETQSFVCTTLGKNAVGNPQGTDGKALFYSPVLVDSYFIDTQSFGGGGKSGDYSQGVVISPPTSLPSAAPVISSVVNAANWQGGPVSPGEIVTIMGTGLGGSTASTLLLDTNGKAATSLGGVKVLIGGFAAPQTYVGANQINAVVPYEVSGAATVTVVVDGQTSNVIPVTLTPAAPALFTADGSGSGQGAILNADGTYNGPGHPVSRGGYVSLYMTGEGRTTASSTGAIISIASSEPWTPQPLLPVTAQIGGQSAFVQFFGEAPGIIAGMMQVNLQIPANAPSGDLPVTIWVGSASTPSGVTVAVR